MGWPTSSGTGHPCVCGEQPLNDLPAPIEDTRDPSGSLRARTSTPLDRNRRRPRPAWHNVRAASGARLM